jgi:hypothetical protein
MVFGAGFLPCCEFPVNFPVQVSAILMPVRNDPVLNELGRDLQIAC